MNDVGSKWEYARANRDGSWGAWKPWPHKTRSNGEPFSTGYTEGGYRKWQRTPVNPPTPHPLPVEMQGSHPSKGGEGPSF